MASLIGEVIENNPIGVKKQRGGFRPGSGRKKGPVTQKEIDARTAKLRFNKRVAANVDKLYNAQFQLATGSSYLFVKRTVGEGKNRKNIVERISDPDIILDYLNGELDNEKDEYYYIATERPVNSAIDSMLDRTFGKAEQTNNDTVKLIIESRAVTERDNELPSGDDDADEDN